MDDAIRAQERNYWLKEARERALDVEAIRTRGDAAHVLAGAELRLQEAEERLTGMEDAKT